jgi:hypothetical protein
MVAQDDPQNFWAVVVLDLIIPLQDENVTASGISRARPSPFSLAFQKTKVVSRVCSEKTNTEHVGFLQNVHRQSVYSELL